MELEGRDLRGVGFGDLWGHGDTSGLWGHGESARIHGDHGNLGGL